MSAEESAMLLNGFSNSNTSDMCLKVEIKLLKSLITQLTKPLDESPMLLNSMVMLSSRFDSAPLVVFAIASIDPETPSKSPRLSKYP